MCLYENYACLYQTIVRSDAGKAYFPSNCIQFYKLFVSLYRKYQLSKDNIEFLQ